MYGAYAPYGLALRFPAFLLNQSVNGLANHPAHAAGSPAHAFLQGELPKLLHLVVVHLEGVADHRPLGWAYGRRGRTPRTGTVWGWRLGRSMVGWQWGSGGISGWR